MGEQSDRVLWGVRPDPVGCLARPARAGIIVTLLTISGCQDELPPIVWEGEHVRVGTDLEIGEWCPGTLTYVDDFAGAVAAKLEIDREPFNYYVYPPPLREHDVCSERAIGCWSRGAVFATTMPETHEIVHGVDAGEGLMPLPFEEGAATYFGGYPPLITVDYTELDIREELDVYWHEPFGEKRYALFGHFTSYLIHTHGLEPYVALTHTTKLRTARAAFDAAFEAAYGLPLDEAMDDYEANWPYCPVEALQSSFFECEREPIVIDGPDPEPFSFDISCGDPQVVGPDPNVNDVQKLWSTATIEFAGPGSYHNLKVEQPGVGEWNSAEIEFKRCDTDCGAVWHNMHVVRPAGLDAAAPNWFTFDAEPGRYVMRVSRNADDPGPVVFTLE
jgi:hypothetical protein